VRSAKETKIYYKKMKFSKPVLVVGLPGVGSVGSLVVEHLRSQFKAKKFATLYSPHFPYQIVLLKNGAFRMITNRFYYIKRGKGKRDVILLTGDAQPLSSEGQYDVNDKIVEFFKLMGGSEIYTIGGFGTGAQYVKSPKVFGLGTDRQAVAYMKKHGITPTDSLNMAVVGSAGMIVAFARKHGIRASCILGETGALEVDANTAKAVLQALGKLLGMDIKLDDIDKLKAETERLMKELEDAQKGAAGQGADRRPQDTASYIR
jgi:uncharacterized protein (TIGR00162 family)